nr:hypothetical protein [Chitinophagaceae bacterium]
SVDSIANDEQITYLGVWKDVQEQAAIRLYADIISELGKCFKINKKCDYDALICDNKAKLVNAWKYLLGNQLMLERIYSDRINRFTTVDKKAAEELKDFYQIEYEKSLTSAAQFMDLGDCHMTVGGNPERVLFLP